MTIHGDWIVAIATLLAGVLGGAGVFYAERRRAAKNLIEFILAPPQDLAAPLRSHGDFAVCIGEKFTKELILSGVSVRNAGNVVIQDLIFEIRIPGSRSLFVADISSESPILKDDITIASHRDSDGPVFRIGAPYLNPDESFRVRCFSDGAESPCKVFCRLPGLKTQILTDADIEKKRNRERSRIDIIGRIYFIFFILIMAFVIFKSFGVQVLSYFSIFPLF
jgi:hypothetical protein